MKHIAAVAFAVLAVVQAGALPPYSGSYALVVGVSKYDAPVWASLPRVWPEVEELTAALQAQGFKVTKVAGRVDSRLMKDSIEQFIAAHGYDHNARIVMTFSGHGFTRRDGRTGYVVPADAPSPTDDEPGFLAKAIPMSQFNEWARQMEALHVLFVFDSCFSGSIFQSRSIATDSRPLTRVLAQPVREFLTAGSANETVPAASVFTPMLIRALQGEADVNQDGLITGTEIGQWILNRPGVFGSETPQFGKILDAELDRGDIVFASPSTAAPSAGAPRPVPTPAPPAGPPDPRAGFYGSYTARGWVETDGLTYDWELQPGKTGLLVRAWRPADRESRSPQAQETYCNWVAGENDEFQCYAIPGRPHVRPDKAENDREMNTSNFQLVLHPDGVLVRELTGVRTTVTLFRRASGRGLRETSGNPVLPGWYADPEARIFEHQYWIYPTYSAPYDEQTFLDAFSSPDLVTWTEHPRIVDTARVSWAKRAVWAPSIVEKGGTYYLFFGANDIQNDNQAGGIGVARASHPGGPFEDHLGKPLVDKFHNGAQPIDPFVFKDEDGTYYLIYGGWRHCNIARLNADFTGFVPFADGTTFKEITPSGYVEGSFMLQKDGKYYFMWSEGGWTGPNYAVAYAIGSSPTGPFERVGKILQQDPAVATGAGHHSILHAPGSTHWYIVYHRRPLGETDRNHRVVCIDELHFDANGAILPVKITNEGVARDQMPRTSGSDYSVLSAAAGSMRSARRTGTLIASITTMR